MLAEFKFDPAAAQSSSILCQQWLLLSLVVKFSRSIIFAFFADELRSAKIVLRKNLAAFAAQHHGVARHHTTGSMALLRYLSKAGEVEKLPDPQGALAKDIPSSVISSANTEVQRVLQLKVDPLMLACYL